VNGTVIERVEAIALDIPLRRPVSFSTRRLTSRRFAIVRIHASDGAVGVGYSYGGQLIAAAVDLELGPQLIGRRSGEIDAIWHDLYQESLLLGRRGVTLRALSAIDIALWDLLGKQLDVTVAQLLGASRTTVPAYFSGGYYRDGEGLEAVAAEAERAVTSGFSSMKIKVGGRPLSEDVERTRLAREVLGSDRRLALDANNAWGDVATALPAIARFAEHEPWWVEEPLAPDNVSGHAELTRRTSVPIATGEIEATRWGFASLVTAGAADVLQPDACVCGGISEWVKIAHLAAAHSLPVAPHWNADVHVHLAAASSNCLAVEWFDVNEDVYNFDLVLAEHLTARGGELEVPARPGIGLVVDEEALNRYRVQ
jgi:L-alanine-DL-glutamate epimerase-like enolase superfamily enzyme